MQENLQTGDRDALLADLTMHVCGTYNNTVGIYNKTTGKESPEMNLNLVSAFRANTYGFTVGSAREQSTKGAQCVEELCSVSNEQSNTHSNWKIQKAI